LLFSDPEGGAAKKLVLKYRYGKDGEVLTDEYPELHPVIEYQSDDRPEHKLYGKMTITIHRASDLKNVASFGGKMDPYFTADASGEDFKSKVAVKAHQNPSWEESFILNLEGKSDSLHLKFLDRNTLSDSMIARVDLALGVLSGNPDPTWYDVVEVSNLQKAAGKVLLSCKFSGRGGARVKKVVKPVAVAPAPQVVVVLSPVAMAAAGPSMTPNSKQEKAPDCHCDKGHAMTYHDEDKCAYKCTGCQQNKSGGKGQHFQCPTCLTYWLCQHCSDAAMHNHYSPPAPLTTPLCNKNHPLTDYTGRKPVGYFDEYRCDVCAQQHRFGQVVKYWHCDVCKTFDCCVPCGEKFTGKSVPAFKAAQCPKHHSLMPGWNTTPAYAHDAPTFKCGKCAATKSYVPSHDYYNCKACQYSVCGDCMSRTKHA